MKCVLIIPPWLPEELFPAQTAGSQVNYWQPLGTLYVAACLQQAGHEVKFLNGAFVNHQTILQQVRQFMPDFAGIYATTFGWDKAVHMANDLKQVKPAIFTCVGGPFPIAIQQQCFDRGGEQIDAVVTGEGEITVTEMVNRLAAGTSLHDVSGIMFREGERVVKNPARPLIEDLDSLPFPARLLLGDAARYVPPPATYRRKPVA